jgi:hypothetical protein
MTRIQSARRPCATRSGAHIPGVPGRSGIVPNPRGCQPGIDHGKTDEIPANGQFRGDRACTCGPGGRGFESRRSPSLRSPARCGVSSLQDRREPGGWFGHPCLDSAISQSMGADWTLPPAGGYAPLPYLADSAPRLGAATRACPKTTPPADDPGAVGLLIAYHHGRLSGLAKRRSGGDASPPRSARSGRGCPSIQCMAAEQPHLLEAYQHHEVAEAARLGRRARRARQR